MTTKQSIKLARKCQTSPLDYLEFNLRTYSKSMEGLKIYPYQIFEFIFKEIRDLKKIIKEATNEN